MRTIVQPVIVLMAIAVAFVGCSKDEEGPMLPATGTLQGAITDASAGVGVAAVRIIVFNANTNAPVGLPLSTDAQGNFTVEISPGTYFLKLSKQGYQDLPPRGISALPLNVTAGQTTTYSVSMFRSGVVGGGFISGTVTSASGPIGGVLVVADDSINGYSSITGTDGVYYVFNLPPGTFRVKGWLTGQNSTDTTVNVLANTETRNVNLALTPGTAGTVTGQITFLATTNIEVDVALTHPFTRETIPGLNTLTFNRLYTIANVPNGTYLARATFVNDGKVVDPDWIIKNGEPFVTVAGGTVSRPFSVTGAAELVSPTNPSTSTQPVTADSIPMFSWQAYPSANHYVVEVINSQGVVIWGGFENNWTVRKVLVPASQTSIVYNADTTATEPLVRGRVYRWKIYVSKDDSQEPLGWKLISVSEDQRGLIRIGQ